MSSSTGAGFSGLATLSTGCPSVFSMREEADKRLANSRLRKKNKFFTQSIYDGMYYMYVLSKQQYFLTTARYK